MIKDDTHWWGAIWLDNCSVKSEKEAMAGVMETIVGIPLEYTIFL